MRHAFSTSLFLFALSALPALAVVDLKLTVTGESSVDDVDAFKVLATITNNGDETVTFLKDPTSIFAPTFQTKTFNIVSDDGSAPEFKGIYLKWSPENSVANKEFVVLEAGKSLDVEHDLGGMYDFTKSGEGSYVVDPKSTFLVVSPSGELSSYPATTVVSHVAKVSGKLASSKTSAARVRTRRGASSYGCTDTQNTDIAYAIAYAEMYVNNSIAYLTNLTEGTPRYTMWFGEWNETRKDIVLSHYTNITGDPSNSTYDCITCLQGQYASAFAYVNPSTPGYVNLCNAFWSAPINGTDSKAGTIVHEQSHFTVNGGTQDFVYGQPGAAALAVSNPDRAIFNADTHEYFAENNPALE